MASFDIKSEIDKHELTNVVDQANRVLKNRFDFKDADAEFKLNLINDILAAKEMYVGRYYFERKKWIAAINRFKYVIDVYETTIYAVSYTHLTLPTKRIV